MLLLAGRLGTEFLAGHDRVIHRHLTVGELPRSDLGHRVTVERAPLGVQPGSIGVIPGVQDVGHFLDGLCLQVRRCFVHCGLKEGRQGERGGRVIAGHIPPGQHVSPQVGTLKGVVALLHLRGGSGGTAQQGDRHVGRAVVNGIGVGFS